MAYLLVQFRIHCELLEIHDSCCVLMQFLRAMNLENNSSAIVVGDKRKRNGSVSFCLVLSIKATFAMDLAGLTLKHQTELIKNLMENKYIFDRSVRDMKLCW